MRSTREVSHGRDSVSDEADEAAEIQAARAERGAFGALYERYRDRVYAYLRTRTNNAEDASDLMQQVFVRALDALPGYRGQPEAFAAWLFQIARNATIDHHRRRRATVAWDLLPEALQPVAVGDLEADVLRREDVEELHMVLATFDRDTRELLALRFAARLSIADTAAVVGKSEAAVKQQLARTMRRLKERYHDHVR
jgi:RNA polymerase sigma-70 factor (ECF subfamily)